MNRQKKNLGLTSEQAAKRLVEYGPNAIASAKKGTLWTIIIEIIKEPMFLLLLVAAAIYLIFGNLQEALFLSVFVMLIIVITLYQQGKAEHALQALRQLGSPRALVLRDGQEMRISGKDVVPGDVVYLNEGDRVPADGELLSANDLQVDESLLTGESLPVLKLAHPSDFKQGMLFSGTMVVQGQAILHVLTTGKDTAIGQIGVKLQQLEVEVSPLQKQTSKLVKLFAFLGLSISCLLTLILGYLHHEWLKAGLSGVALAMTLLPEEFPVILTVFPALGAWRLSQNKVLTRRLSAIETLGAISILCTDKTGTITENRMEVQKIWGNNQEALAYANHASEIQPFDPMEKAFFDAAKRALPHFDDLHTAWTLVKEYDRTTDLPVKTHVWKNDKNPELIVSVKGAPESIIQLCNMENNEQQEIALIIKEMAGEGLRVLGIAKGTFNEGDDWPSDPTGFNFQFVGLIGLADPIRANIKKSVKECQAAGIRLMMITGDHPTTAKSIAQQAGFIEREVIVGTELSRMDDQALLKNVDQYNIYARINPSQKLRLVEALKKKGYIVAMTGDGVNDAPALKAAHVGVAMGQRGTDVAREAASLVLLDDNFTSIIAAIRQGRRTYNNIIKSISYILSVHVPIAGLALIPVIIGWPAMFYPMHIAFLQLIIDPACSIAFENEPADKDIMQRSPRDPLKPLIDRRSVIYSLMQGAGVLVLCLLTYYFALLYYPPTYARAFTFSSLVIANILLIYANRSQTRSIFVTFLIYNKLLFMIIGFTLIFLYLIIYVPFLAKLFQFSALSLTDLLFSIGIAAINVIWFEAVRQMKRRLKH
ncbi:MAG: cation-translocating P-type ATPase [Candidatus Berkiella sp.]